MQRKNEKAEGCEGSGWHTSAKHFFGASNWRFLSYMDAISPPFPVQKPKNTSGSAALSHVFARSLPIFATLNKIVALPIQQASKRELCPVTATGVKRVLKRETNYLIPVIQGIGPIGVTVEYPFPLCDFFWTVFSVAFLEFWS